MKNLYSIFIAIGMGLLPHASFGAKEFDFDYPLLKAPKGSFTLHIPINTAQDLVYIPKKIEFKKPFYIGKYEVSNRLWSKCHQDGGCAKEAFYSAEEGKNNPSVRLNWHDAYQFTKWISKKINKKYRLPTEEEWAYAAYMGDDKSQKDSDKVVTYDYSENGWKDLAVKTTRPIGSINKNDWGMHDYFGNVWEWTLTCWHGSKENMLKVRSIKELNTPKACATRVTRGETRAHIPDFISDTYNGGCATLRPAANLGFRLVMEEEK